MGGRRHQGDPGLEHDLDIGSGDDMIRYPGIGEHQPCDSAHSFKNHRRTGVGHGPVGLVGGSTCKSDHTPAEPAGNKSIHGKVGHIGVIGTVTVNGGTLIVGAETNPPAIIGAVALGKEVFGRESGMAGEESVITGQPLAVDEEVAVGGERGGIALEQQADTEGAILGDVGSATVGVELAAGSDITEGVVVDHPTHAVLIFQYALAELVGAG